MSGSAARMKGTLRTSHVLHDGGIIEIAGIWKRGEATRENGERNLRLIRSRLPYVVILTNDEVYRFGVTSRQHAEGLPEGIVWSGELLPEALSEYEVIEVSAGLGGCWSLEQGPGVRSLLVRIGGKGLGDFVSHFMGNVWPISYVFMFSDSPVNPQPIAEIIEQSKDIQEFLTRALELVKLIWCARESEFAIFTRSDEVTELIPAEYGADPDRG